MRTALFISLLVTPALTQAQEPIDIGTRRELPCETGYHDYSPQLQQLLRGRPSPDDDVTP